MAAENSKTARLEARLPESVRVLLDRAAALQGRSLSDFVVSSAREAAERTIAQHDVLALSVSDQQMFAERLLAPEPVVEPLRHAAERRKRLIDRSERSVSNRTAKQARPHRV